LDKYIRAKFADDSELWDGKTFSDWFDQALRKTDSPEFISILANYLKSKDFVSGLTGYKVGVDTEVETLKVRRFLEVVEYLVNQISLIGDEVILKGERLTAWKYWKTVITNACYERNR